MYDLTNDSMAHELRSLQYPSSQQLDIAINMTSEISEYIGTRIPYIYHKVYTSTLKSIPLPWSLYLYPEVYTFTPKFIACKMLKRKEKEKQHLLKCTASAHDL